MAVSIATLSLWRTSTYQLRTLFVSRSALKSIGKFLVWKGGRAAVPAFDRPIRLLIMVA
jgi:hypothetical protein